METRPLRIINSIPYPTSWSASILIHPHAQNIENDVISWLDEHGLMPLDKHKAMIQAVNISKYTCYPMPTLSYRSTLGNAIFLTLWLLWDDVVIERMNMSDADLHMIEQYVKIMAGDWTWDDVIPTAPHDIIRHRFLLAWDDLMTTFYNTASHSWRQRFSLAMKDWIEWAYQECTLYQALAKKQTFIASTSTSTSTSMSSSISSPRHTHNFPLIPPTPLTISHNLSNPSFSTIEYQRLQSVGMIQTCYFIEFGMHLDFPDFIINHPLTREILSLAAKLVYIINELVSLGKDYNEQWPNVIEIYKIQQSLTLPQAIDIWLEQNQQVIQRFNECEQLMLTHLSHTAPSYESSFRAWMTAIHHACYGFARWHTECERYQRELRSEDGISYWYAIETN